jgi:hypothetical protein
VHYLSGRYPAVKLQSLGGERMVEIEDHCGSLGLADMDKYFFSLRYPA